MAQGLSNVKKYRSGRSIIDKLTISSHILLKPGVVEGHLSFLLH